MNDTNQPLQPLNDEGPDAKPIASASGGPEAGSLIDLDGLRLSQDFASAIGVKKARLTVPIRKPTRHQFVRVHPSEDYRLQTAVLNLKEEQEVYLVDRPLWQELAGEIAPTALYTTISRQGVLFLWPIRLPGEDGKLDAWSRSALEAAEMATTRWVRVASNRDLGAYEAFGATGDLPDAEWPEESFQELLQIASRDRHIRSLDHPVIQRLWGVA